MENVSLLSNKLCVITHFFTGIWLFSSSTKRLYYLIFLMVKYRVGLNIFQTGQYLRFPWAVTEVTIFLDAVLHSLVDCLSVLKMDTADSSDMSVNFYQSTRHHTAGDSNLYLLVSSCIFLF